MIKLHRFAFTVLVLLVCLGYVGETTAQVKLSKMNFDENKTYLITMNDGKRYAGRVSNFGSYLAVMRRNGRLVEPREYEIKSIKKVADEFEPKTFQQMRIELQKEFGSRYVVSQTAHFLVVHPPGKYEKWAWPLEQIYMRFQVYCKSRGIETSEPEFPLVAVILRTKNEFQRIASQRNVASAAGYYHANSNRFFTYLQSYDWMSESENLEYTISTMQHETAHQLAYNLGVQDRLAGSRRWVSEGFANLFEAKGVSDLIAYPDLGDRVEWESLERYREFRKSNQAEGVVETLISNGNHLFRASVHDAYASSWALSFYLTERRSRDYANFLSMIRKDFYNAPMSSKIHQSRFVKAFGSPEAVEAEMNRFIDSLPEK